MAALLVTSTIAEHTLHCDGSTGSACVACCMPKIAAETPVVFMSARTLAFIYTVMTDKYEILNARPSRHADKTSECAASSISKWNSDSPWRME
jgi:hypothetical protein